MKKGFKLKLSMALILFCIFPVAAWAQEITLFDSEGSPRAYIDLDDEDCTIYLWDGTPTCYLTVADGFYEYFNIYGFNGKHLGWLEDGIIVDHNGYAVGFVKGAISKYTQFEPYKSYKKYKPYKSYKQYAPYKPYFKRLFSSEPLGLFLLRGSK